MAIVISVWIRKRTFSMVILFASDPKLFHSKKLISLYNGITDQKVALQGRVRENPMAEWRLSGSEMESCPKHTLYLNRYVGHMNNAGYPIAVRRALTSHDVMLSGRGIIMLTCDLNYDACRLNHVVCWHK